MPVQNPTPSVEIGLVKTLQFLDPSDEQVEIIAEHLEHAVMHGSVLARYLLWEQKYEYSDDWVSLLLFVVITSFVRL